MRHGELALCDCEGQIRRDDAEAHARWRRDATRFLFDEQTDRSRR
ncbi:MAG: hypothetical protein U0353_15880 [Sandaracinus sp.]